MRHTLTACVLLVVLSGIFAVGPARAQSLEMLLEDVLQTDHRVIGAKAEVTAAENRAREALGDWFPLFEPTANHGYELTQNPHEADTSLPFSEFDLSLTQKLWDFGATNALVEKARLELSQKQLTLIKIKEDLILEAINAYVNLFKVYHSLTFARQSKDNVQRQTGLEVARVETGSGLSTDVLQAKSQLAGAIAREIQSEGALLAARNRYRTVFGNPPNPETMQPVALPMDQLSATLEDAIDLALDHNTQISIDALAEAISRQDQQNSYSDNFFPKIEGVLTQKWKNNVSGTEDLKKESLAKIEITMPFNLGFTATNTLRAAESDVIAKSRVVAHTRRDIEEQVRNAWQELNTAKLTASSLQNQADIQAAFLELARQERQLGQRSLIDVLTGETALLNAQSDSVSAETDVIVAAFKLLSITGQLKEDFAQQALARPGAPVRLPPVDQSHLEPSDPKAQPIDTLPLQPGTTEQASANPQPIAARTAIASRQSGPETPTLPATSITDAGISADARKPFDTFFSGVRNVFNGHFDVQDNAPRETQGD